MKAKLKHTEAQEHSMLCRWLKIQYPKIMFNTDMSGIRLSMNMAIKAKSLRSNNGFPDLFIIEPRNGFAGLFIELKRTGEKLLKKNYEYASPHLKEQAEVHDQLRCRGFKCMFAIGFEEAQMIIENYLT